MSYKVKSKPKKEKDFETRSYKVYAFDKLPKEAQKKAIEKYRYFNVEDRNLVEDDEGFFDSNYTFNKAYYSTDYDHYLQLTDLEVRDDESFRKELGIPQSIWDKVSYKFVNSGRNNNTKLEFYEEEKLSAEEQKALDKATEKFAVKMKQAEKDLTKTYEAETSDEAVKGSLIANDYRFKENGEID
jgi:hypothetical protein